MLAARAARGLPRDEPTVHFSKQRMEGSLPSSCDPETPRVGAFSTYEAAACTSPGSPCLAVQFPGGTCDLGRLCSCLSPPSRPPGPRSRNSRHHGDRELSVSFGTLLSGSS